MKRLFPKIKSFFSQIIHNRDFLILLIAGIVSIGIIDSLAVQKWEHEQEYRHTLVAQQLQAKIQSSLEEHVSALNALNVVYQNFVEINHYDFQQYGQTITNNLQGFHRLLYLDPAMTIRQIYPLSPENTGLYNVSLRKDAQYAQLLTRAKSTRKSITSPLITFLDHPKSILAVIPIYRSNNEFLGYAVGEISLTDIWGPIGHQEFLNQYQVQLLDSMGKGYFDERFPQGNDRIRIKNVFTVADKPWTLMVQSAKPTFEALLLQRTGVWGIGLLILWLVLLLVMAAKRHKISLNEAQRQFETIFQASPDGIMLLDDALHFQLANPRVKSWSGLEENTLKDKTFFDLFTCQCPHLNKCRELSFLLCTSEQFEENIPELLEAQMLYPSDGMTRTLRLNASRINPTGFEKQRAGFICVLGDISTGKELERVKETFIATLTHDLKTPLIAQEMVLNSLLLGKSGELNQEQRKLLDGAGESVKDLLEMVNSALVYFKLESNHLMLHKQPASLAALTKDVMEVLRPIGEKRNLSFKLETAVDLPDVWVDPIQLKRVLHNILSNAISYARRDSVIRVGVQKDSQDKLLIGIFNEGKGIAPSELPKVFEKYYSLSRKFKQIGTGLGLYISRRIVELHGGKIWAESEVNKETRFFISLPCPQHV